MKTIFLPLILFLLCAMIGSCSKDEQDFKTIRVELEQSPAIFLELKLTDLMATYTNKSKFLIATDSGTEEEILTVSPMRNEADLTVDAVQGIYAIFKKLSAHYDKNMTKTIFIRALHKQIQSNYDLTELDVSSSNFAQSSDLPCYRYWKSEIDAAIVDVFGCVDSPPNILDSMTCFGAFLDRIVAANHVFIDCMKQYEID